MTSFALPKLLARDRAIERIATFLARLSSDRAWSVTVEEKKPKRSYAQNRLLWSLYAQILERGGEDMRGWTRDDLHQFFLIHHFGSDIKDLFGRKRHVPLRRSSELNKQEFADFIEAIVRFMAEQGVALDLPDDQDMAA